MKTKPQFVWSVHFSSQAWLRLPILQACCVPVGMNAKDCEDVPTILFDNAFFCENHYNEEREFELEQYKKEAEYTPEEHLGTARPELQWKRAERLETENILESLGPCEGGPVDGKDWIQELNETEKGEV